MAHEKILVVEDDGIIAAQLENILIRKGYEVCPLVATGEEAIERTKECRPQLVIMDINLGSEMDGITAAEHIHSSFDVPIVYLTGYSEESFLERAKITAPYGYLLKPVNERELAATIRMALSRRELDLKLQESEERYRIAIENSNDGVAIMAEGKYVFVNEKLCKILGYTRDEIMGQSLLLTIHPDGVETARQCMLARQRGETTPSSCERRVVRKDGTTTYVEDSVADITYHGQPAWLAYVRDITERKRIEEDLQRSEERFKNITDVMSDCAYALELKSDGSLKIDWITCGVLEKTGHSAADIPSLDAFVDIVHPEDRAGVASGLGHIFAGQDKVTDYRIITKTGGVRWIHGYTRPFPLADGSVHVVGAMQDITERKQAEENQKRLEARIRQLQKEESLGCMAEAIAHHYNNLMTAVLGSLEMALEDVPADSDAHPSITNALDASRRASDISLLMLTYLGHGMTGKEIIDLSDACRVVLSSLMPQVPPRIRVTSRFLSSGPFLLNNRAHIRNALSILMTNAIEAVSEDGEITISVETVRAEDIRAERFYPSDWVLEADFYGCLSVSDTGSGMTPEILDSSHPETPTH
jgi:PAS domain S-box-containing protein